MKKNEAFYVIMMLVIAVVLSAGVLPSSAQDEWPEDCQLPDLEEAVGSAKRAQASGDALAYLENLSDIVDSANLAYGNCLGEIARSSDALAGVNLNDSNLEGANLSGANLQGAELYFVDLDGADLSYANLQAAIFPKSHMQADLHGANLQAARFNWANLQGASLKVADLRGANFNVADLQAADLTGANLQGADLSWARLEDAVLSDTTFDETTILPDGTNWTPNTDMARFTDRTHPHFWDSCLVLGKFSPNC
jgi:hypothetical protein